MAETYDVLVIGAGPAGSRAAEAAASAGARVLLVERKRRIGAVPHCAEFVPSALGLEIDFPANSRVQAVEGLETHLGGEVSFLPAPGWILDRQVFDFSLASRAASAGAYVWAGTSFLGIEGACYHLKRSNDRIEIKAGAVVAAMGAAPGSARILGRDEQPLLVGVQVVVPLAQPLKRTQVFLAEQFRGGYAWLFPRGEVANLGLGCEPSAGPRGLLEALRQEQLQKRVIGEGVLGMSSGAIPVGGPLAMPFKKRVLFCGDAAGLTHPITGAGIPQALASGLEAGSAAVALAGGDPGAGQDYAQALNKAWHSYLKRGLTARQAMETGWDADFTQTMAQVWPGWKS